MHFRHTIYKCFAWLSNKFFKNYVKNNVFNSYFIYFLKNFTFYVAFFKKMVYYVIRQQTERVYLYEFI